MAEPNTHRHTTVALLGGCMIFCAAFVWLSAREFLAARASRQHTLDSLQQAVLLSPENAGYRDQLGLALLFSGEWPRAQEHLKAATALNPYEPRYWLDLSRLRQTEGDTTEAATAADQAVAIGGTYGWVLWEAGLLHLGQNDYAKALGLFHHALQVDALPADRVVDLCWRTTGNVEMMLDLLMPPRPEPYAALMNTMARENRVAEADAVWERMLRIGQDLPANTSFSYIDFLLRQGRANDARMAWQSLSSANPRLRGYPSSGDLVENGGFELDLLNGGFDWRYSARPDAVVSISTDRCASGQRSLRIAFHAEEFWDAPLVQYVTVKPNTSYLFSARVSTEGIWSVSGPRLRVRDSLSAKDYVLSDEFTGTMPWKTVDARFTTAANTNLLSVTVARVPGDTSISGDLWLDDVSLREAR